MISKIFKVGECPFRSGIEVGSTGCRTCADYKGEPAYCSFVICSHEGEIEQKAVKIARKAPEIARKAPEIAQPKRKRGRPPGKAKKKPVKRKTKTK